MRKRALASHGGLRPDEDGTRVELTHTGWEAYGSDAGRLRTVYTGPDAWTGVLARYARLEDRDGHDRAS